MNLLAITTIKNKKRCPHGQTKKKKLGVLLSVRTELEHSEDVVCEDSAVKVVHRQPEGATRLVVGSVDHQKLGTVQLNLNHL